MSTTKVESIRQTSAKEAAKKKWKIVKKGVTIVAATQNFSNIVESFTTISRNCVTKWIDFCSILKLIPFERVILPEEALGLQRRRRRQKEINKYRKFPKSSWRIRLFYFVQCTSAVFSIINTYCGINYIIKFGLDTKFFLSLFFMQCPLIAVCFSLASWLNPYEAVNIMNQSDKLLGMRVRNAWRDKVYKKMGCFKDFCFSFFALQMAINSVTVMVTFLALFFLIEDAPMYVWDLGGFHREDYSLLPWIMINIAFVMVEVIHFGIPYNVTMVTTCLFLFGFATIRLELKALEKSMSSISGFKGGCISLDLNISSYQRLALYNQIFNSWARQHLMPTVVTTIFCTLTFTTYMTVIGHGHMPLFIYAMYPNVVILLLVGVPVVYGELAKIREKSAKLCEKFQIHARKYNESGKRNVRMKFIYKRAISLKPMGVNIRCFGSFSIMTAWGTIENAINCVLTLLNF